MRIRCAPSKVSVTACPVSTSCAGSAGRRGDPASASLRPPLARPGHRLCAALHRATPRRTHPPGSRPGRTGHLRRATHRPSRSHHAGARQGQHRARRVSIGRRAEPPWPTTWSASGPATASPDSRRPVSECRRPASPPRRWPPRAPGRSTRCWRASGAGTTANSAIPPGASVPCAPTICATPSPSNSPTPPEPTATNSNAGSATAPSAISPATPTRREAVAAGYVEEF